MPRSRSSGALSIESNARNCTLGLFFDATFVRAAVKVVLPWSMCPIVPTFTCGLLRSNFSLAMSAILYPRRALRRARRFPGADDQNRTGDLVLTKDALCLLSYIGLCNLP